MATYQDYFSNRRFVAFVDILGFSALVKRIHQDPGLLSKVLEVVQEVARFRPDLPGGESNRVLRNFLAVTTFSDSIVISANDQLGPTIVPMATSLLCLRLLALGVFTRGGIACGSLYHEESVVFGDALIDAYRLENEVARYPRVVLSEEVSAEMRNRHPRIGWPTLQKEDFDGMTLLHYLNADMKPFCRELFKSGDAGSDHPESYDPDLVRRVLENALVRETELSIRAKLIWFAKYFNEYAGGLGLAPVPLETQ